MSLLSERLEWIITAKVYVFSDSILCQDEIDNPSTADEAWRKKLNGTARITSLKI